MRLAERDAQPVETGRGALKPVADVLLCGRLPVGGPAAARRVLTLVAVAGRVVLVTIAGAVSLCTAAVGVSRLLDAGGRLAVAVWPPLGVSHRGQAG